MIDRSQSVEIEAFEHVLAVPGIALLRVLVARPRRRSSSSRPNLVIREEQSTHRFAPLPAPDDPHGILRAAYSVPVELLEHEVTFALEFQSGAPLMLAQPTAGSMRLPARPAQQDPEQSGTGSAEPDAELDEDRRVAIHEKLVQQSQALAESERAATARDRSQRRAQAKLQAELEQHQEEEQRAWTRVGELERQLEQQAAEIVARIASSDAELAQAGEALSDADQRAGAAAELAAAAQTRAEAAERRIPELEAAADAHAQRSAELEQRHERMQQELAIAESERTRIGEKLAHASDALRVMTFERDELVRQVGAHDSVAVKARERATHSEQSDAESSEALRELETWRQELERRLAGLTSELAATKTAFEDAERERTRLDGELGESDARTELAEGRNANLTAHVTRLTAQLSEREAELADAVRAADESSARAEAKLMQDERDAVQVELERLGSDLDATTARTEDAERSAQEHGERAAALQARVSSLEEAAARLRDERTEHDRGQAADAAELNALRAAEAKAQATLATLRAELEDARRRASHSDDLEREVEASRSEANRLQAAVAGLESDIRSTEQGQLDSLRNGSERELAAISSALDGAREEMDALRRELEVALASERQANLELVMLTAETQARLQAQSELRQAASESGLSQ